MASLYQNSAPGRPPGGGGPPPGGAFRPNHGPPPQHPPPGTYNPNHYGPPPPPPGAYNPNPYPGSVALPPPPAHAPPPMPPPYGAAPPPPPPPPSGPPQHPPPPPQYHPSAPHYGPPHQSSHHHAHPQHAPHQPAGPHGSMNPHQQNLGHGNHGHQASLNQGHNLGHGGNRSNVQSASHSSQHRPAGSQASGLASQHANRSFGGQGGGGGAAAGGAAGVSLSRGSSLSAATHQSRRQETEEERRERKKKEYERNKAEERAKRSSQPGATSSRPGAPVNGSRDPRAEKRSVPAADKIENRLKRPSTFLCKIRFRNELPDPVSQPKLMHINNDKDQYTKYTVTSLENNYKHKLYVEPDLGIPLDLLDLSAYNAPQVRPAMDPADAELLLDDEVVKKETMIRKKDRPTDKGVAWLVKTQYISPLSLDPAKQAISEKQAKELKDQREGERLIRDLNDRDQQIQAIEESFKVAKQLPVHQTKPELEAVEVLPLLPYFDRWSDQFVHMIFDTDPTGESEVLSKMDEEMRDEIEARAIVKSCSLPNPAEDQKPEKYLAYMVPKPEELERDIYEDDDDIGYTWVREYKWDARTDPEQSTYVFCFGEDGVNYLPLHTKLVLQKKKAKEGRPKDEEFDNQFPVPSRVTVHRRDLTEELRVKDETRQSFLEGQIHDNGAIVKRRRSPEPMAAPPAKRKIVVEEAVLNREDISDDEEEMSV